MEFNETISESIGKVYEKVEGWIEAVILNIPNLILAIFVAIVGYFFSRLLVKGTIKFTRRFTNNSTVLNLVKNLTQIFLAVLILFLILGIFDLNSTINKILATAGVIGLAVGLALQDPLVNLFSGVMMSVKGLYQIGDIVETNGYTGTIKYISLRSTRLETFGGQEVIIPNKDVIQNPLTNYSFTGLRRIEIPVGVGYATDLEKVKSVALETIKGLENVLPEQPIDVIATEFGDSSINFNLRFWVSFRKPANYLATRSAAIIAIKKAFDENDILIPFPIRTLDFGIEGGIPLSKELPATMLNNNTKDNDGQ